MKSQGTVLQKLKQVQFRYRSKLIAKHLTKVPCNCSFNRKFEGPTESVGVCLYGADVPNAWKGLVCDEAYGGKERAAQCPYFEFSRTKDQIKQDFEAFVMQADLAEIAYQYPDMAALMWVLGEEERPLLGDDDEVSGGAQIQQTGANSFTVTDTYVLLPPLGEEVPQPSPVKVKPQSLWEQWTNLFFGKGGRAR